MQHAERSSSPPSLHSETAVFYERLPAVHQRKWVELSDGTSIRAKRTKKAPDGTPTDIICVAVHQPEIDLKLVFTVSPDGLSDIATNRLDFVTTGTTTLGVPGVYRIQTESLTHEQGKPAMDQYGGRLIKWADAMVRNNRYLSPPAFELKPTFSYNQALNQWIDARITLGDIREGDLREAFKRAGRGEPNSEQIAQAGRKIPPEPERRKIPEIDLFAPTSIPSKLTPVQTNP